MSVVVSLDVEAGSDFSSDSYQWLDTSGVAVDLTHATAVLDLSSRIGGAPFLSLTGGPGTASSGVKLGGTAGTIAFVIPGADTSGVAQGAYPCTLQISGAGASGSTAATMFISGTVNVRGTTIP